MRKAGGLTEFGSGFQDASLVGLRHSKYVCEASWDHCGMPQSGQAIVLC